MLAFWMADSYLDGVLFSEGGFSRQFFHPEARELVYRIQTLLFLIVLIVYARRKALAQERLTSSLEEALTSLAAEKGRSEAILAAMPDAVSVQDTSLKIIFQNPACKESMGDHVGEYCHDAYHQQSSVCPGCNLVKSFADGLSYRREVSVSEGSPYDAEIVSAPLKDGAGRIIAGIESVRNITDRKLAESRLRQQLAAIEASMDGIAILNAAGEYLYLNKAHATVYGYPSPDELLGKSWQVLYTVEERQRLESLIYESFAKQGSWRGAATGLKKDGTLYPQEISLTVLDDGGIICVVSDITERKKAEEEIRTLNDSLSQQALDLQATNQELEAFNYSLSHDLRSPLTGIYMAAQTLDEICRGKLDDNGLIVLGAIRQSCEKMDELIEAMLVLSRVSRTELSCAEVDLSDLATEILAQHQLCSLDRQLQWHVDEGITAWLDPHQARILLENLLGNAWKYTATTDHPRIEFGQTMRDGVTQFFVRDNGVGFDMGEVQEMFKPFQRLHRCSDFPGSGIGLATAQRIIDRHAGQIWAEGEVGRGATFYFSLPTPP
jgi:PAS domain S-box-containing protein